MSDWNVSPDEARQKWHTEARERDEEYVATLPDDDTERSVADWWPGTRDPDDGEHDERCEADMVIPGGWTPCRCAERAAGPTPKGTPE